MDHHTPPSLGVLIGSCTALFEQSAKSTPSHLRQKFENRLAAFRLWAGNAGERLTTGDTELVNQKEYYIVVKGVLRLLQSHLQSCIDIVRSKEIVDETLLEIDLSLKNLMLLGGTKLQAGNGDRIDRGGYTSNCSELEELEAHLRFILTVSPSPKTRDFTSLSQLTPIQERLVAANLRRRSNFLRAQELTIQLESESGKQPPSFTPQVGDDKSGPTEKHRATTDMFINVPEGRDIDKGNDVGVPGEANTETESRGGAHHINEQSASEKAVSRENATQFDSVIFPGVVTSLGNAASQVSVSHSTLSNPLKTIIELRRETHVLLPVMANETLWNTLVDKALVDVRPVPETRIQLPSMANETLWEMLIDIILAPERQRKTYTRTHFQRRAFKVEKFLKFQPSMTTSMGNGHVQ
ncbi:hypothetical protein K456DRAFT_1721359 [Colletotrichum gloeosporioides 23]|nr:hypothetical protein K456DRAFT_1721359 [Colletotrichum gloeosporioides 23]